MKRRAALIAGAAFLGMVDAFYLTMKGGSGRIECHVTAGCNDVLASSYSELAGIPIAWFGLAFYVTTFIIAVFEAFGTAKLLDAVFWMASAAFAVSIVLTGIQAFVLNAFCEYCLASAGLVTTILVLSPRPSRHKHPR